MMENTKALEVVERFERQFLIFLDYNDKTRAIRYIQAAIDEATADLRAQLAERDAQLAAEYARGKRDALNDVLEAIDDKWDSWANARKKYPNSVNHDLSSKEEAANIIRQDVEAMLDFEATRQPTQDKED